LGFVRRSPGLVWFRLDLRLKDHPAFHAAIERGGPVVPVFVWAPEEETPWEPGAASRWWLHHSLSALDGSMRSIGARLIIRRGPTSAALLAVAKEVGAEAVFWNDRYEPAVVSLEATVAAVMREAGLEVSRFNGRLFNEPWAIKNKSGRPFQVFTPYWKRCMMALDPALPLRAPRSFAVPVRWPRSESIESLELEPAGGWASKLGASWQPGEVGAGGRLREFVKGGVTRYGEERNRPDRGGTSRLSPHLHFGEISPRQVWHALKREAGRRKVEESEWRTWPFLVELGWREFAHQLLYHFPRTTDEPLREEYGRFPWRQDPEWLRAWQRGRTGYPFVDAGMRELWGTGWMHNRVRMVVGSFLVKDLLLDWREGARWFWDTLVDADLAQNTMGWQWTAGCGADAAQFFRIFNPNGQGERFDPRGDYVRRWVPELGRLPVEWIHRPHEAPGEVLARAGVELGRTYPWPIVRHAIAREAALEALSRVRLDAKR
jgi:deoxyribodipyrimidine photo-lyase